MKKILCFLFCFTVYVSHGQETKSKKPEYVIIINDKITTKAQVDEYGKKGYIKSMSKGVSAETRAKLAQKFGDKIGDKEFIVMVSLFTEEEKLAHAKTSNNEAKIVSSQEKNEYMLKVNDLAKDFEVTMLEGKKIKLSDLRGKVVLINFWATWCAPCIMEFYDFPSKLIVPFKNSAFVLLPIAKGETMEVVREKMNKLKKDGITFNVGNDLEESIFKLYAKGSIPKSFLIDKKGVIRYISTGNSEDNLANIAAMTKRLLEE